MKFYKIKDDRIVCIDAIMSIRKAGCTISIVYKHGGCTESFVFDNDCDANDAFDKFYEELSKI